MWLTLSELLTVSIVFLKMSKDELDCMAKGNLFHKDGPEWGAFSKWLSLRTVNPLSNVPAVTRRDECDQNWNQLHSTSAGGIDLTNDKV